MSGRGPVLRRRQIGTLAAGAACRRRLAGAARSVRQAADASTFVSGFGLPVNLDPHQVYDVPMQSMMLNAYDNLYRYEGDPPKMQPWLAESHTVSADGLDLGIQAAARRSSSTTAARSPPRTWSTASAACWRWQGAGRRLPARS